jgi:hypothetical protein
MKFRFQTNDVIMEMRVNLLIIYKNINLIKINC